MIDGVRQVAAAAARAGLTVVDALLGLGRPPLLPRSRDRLRLRARRTVWRLRRAYEDAAGDRSAVDELRDLASVLPSTEAMCRAFVAWFDLVETLVQAAERQYGSAPGGGAYKAEQVKAVLIELVINQDLPIPNAVIFAQPLLIEAVIDWTVDSIVLVLNRNGIWEAAHPREETFGIWARLMRAVHTVVRWLVRAGPIARLMVWLRRALTRAVLARHPLSPALREAVDELRRQHLLDVDQVVVQTVRVVQWAVEHRQRVVAIVELVSTATQEAETFVFMSGPQKKEYARDLVLEFLEQLGFVERDSLWEALVMQFIDFAIDAVVRVFHKRALFQHRSRLAG